jgi:hypothetical protein
MSNDAYLNQFPQLGGHGEIINQGYIDHVNALIEEAAQQDNKLLKSGKSVEQAIDEYLNMRDM